MLLTGPPCGVNIAAISKRRLWGEHSIAVARAGVLAQELDTVNPSSEERENRHEKALQKGSRLHLSHDSEFGGWSDRDRGSPNRGGSFEPLLIPKRQKRF